MAIGETVITIVGNLTADPELRTTGQGAQVASFTIANTPRQYNRQTGQYEDGDALFLRCSAWNDLAQHCIQSLSKGMRVIAQGRLKQHSYQAQDGQKRTVAEVIADSVEFLTSRAEAAEQAQSALQNTRAEQSAHQMRFTEVEDTDDLPF